MSSYTEEEQNKLSHGTLSYNVIEFKWGKVTVDWFFPVSLNVNPNVVAGLEYVKMYVIFKE